MPDQELMKEQQQSIIDFDKSRNQLLTITSQKQQLQVQSNSLREALDELKKTSEKKVFKLAGSILVLSSTKETEKEVKDHKESIDLRLKSLQKQEDALIEKLNKLKSKIEGSFGSSEQENKNKVDE